MQPGCGSAAYRWGCGEPYRRTLDRDSIDSGAVYVYDRKRCVWLWVDFEDQNYGGYSPSEFDVLVNQCHFLRIVESPGLLHSPAQWFVTPGQQPERLLRRPV